MCVLVIRTLHGSSEAAQVRPMVLQRCWEGVRWCDVPGSKQKLKRMWGLRSVAGWGLCANESRVDGLGWTSPRRKGANARASGTWARRSASSYGREPQCCPKLPKSAQHPSRRLPHNTWRQGRGGSPSSQLLGLMNTLGLSDGVDDQKSKGGLVVDIEGVRLEALLSRDHRPTDHQTLF